MIEFLRMGGYAPYVWPSYALTLAAFLLNIFWARRSLRLGKQQAQRRLAAQRSRP